MSARGLVAVGALAASTKNGAVCPVLSTAKGTLSSDKASGSGRQEANAPNSASSRTLALVRSLSINSGDNARQGKGPNCAP